jgi:MFS transporter, DHA1 family, inner membrane transport protein
MAAFSAAFFAVFGFLPSILSDRPAVGPTTGSLMAALAVAVNALGNLACSPLLTHGVRRPHILLIGFVTMALCGFGILAESVSGPVAYTLCVLFSAVGGLIPVALIDGAPRHAPRPDLVGATVGFLMQGNAVGLLLGPAISGGLAAALGWPMVSFFIAALAFAAVILTLALRTRSAEQVLSSSTEAPLSAQAS